jgi:hypothetical protein
MHRSLYVAGCCFVAPPALVAVSFVSMSGDDDSFTYDSDYYIITIDY